MDLLLTNARWLDPDTLTVRTRDLRVTPGPNGTMTFQDTPPANPGELQIIDCNGRLVTRSFVLGHHHLYSTFARGMPAPPRVPQNFPEILDLVWWRVDKRLDLPMIEASALSTALLCAKRGVTFVVDHHASPFAVKGSLETIVRAFERVGLGHLLCYEMSCRDGDAVKEAGLAETASYLESGRVGHVGLHASFTVDDDLLNRAVAMGREYGAGLHLHVAEDVADQKHCEATYGKRVVQRLADAGALDDERTLLAHCVHLDDAERALLADAPVRVAQASESNLNNAVGLGRYDYLPDGHVILGTDGMHVDMLRSTKAAHVAAQTAEDAPFDAAFTRLRACHQLVAATGAPGDGPNNLVIFDYDSPTPLTDTNAVGHFLFGLEATHVRTVIAQGRVVVDEGCVTTIDEADVLSYAKEQACRLWKLLEDA